MSDENLGDVPAAEFREQLHRLADWMADYRENIETRRVAPSGEPGTVTRALPQSAPETGESFDAIYRDIDELITPNVLHWGHPRFTSYFGATTTAPGIEADMVAAALNVNAMTWRTSPAATELETVVINWLREWMTLDQKFDGVVYDTASISSMHALAAAREEKASNARGLGVIGRADLKPMRVYVSDQAHSSIEKSAIALGIGEKNVQRVPTDNAFAMNVQALREFIARDLAQNLQPLAVVATVGTTSTASVDPVSAISQVCREHGIWLHIDAAYGGGLALLPENHWVTSGWNEADSFVVNPHKMLFVPFDFSVLYVRDIERLRRVFTLVPEYLRGDTLAAEKNYMDYGVPLGRRFRAIKAWMVWRTFGRKGIAARVREQMRLAQVFADLVKSDDRFELAAPVVMGVVCFRCNADDATNRKIVEQINASGRAYLNVTELRGRTVIRLGLGNILTAERHVREVWELVQEQC